MKYMFSIIFLLILTSGCFFTPDFKGSGLKFKDANETSHYFIIGIGVVSFPKICEEPKTFVTKSQNIGLEISNYPSLKFSAGYSNYITTVVPEINNNVVIDVSSRPFGPLTINSINVEKDMQNEK